MKFQAVEQKRKENAALKRERKTSQQANYVSQIERGTAHQTMYTHKQQWIIVRLMAVFPCKTGPQHCLIAALDFIELLLID